MKKVFTKKDIEKIAQVLRAEPKFLCNNFRFVLKDEQGRNELSFEIYPDIPIGTETGNLITVYTRNSHLQLHFCTGYVVSESLGEVTFFGECGGRLSGLIIERGAGCSLYANVHTEILSGDFTNLAPEIMLSGVALSLAEQSLPQTNP